MKNTLFSILIALLVLPALTPLMPHEGLHALHDHQSKHHNADRHGHSHGQRAQDHDTKTQANNHHPISFDAVTYFSELLHVDLQNPDQIVLTAPAPDTYDIDLMVAAVIEPTSPYELTSVQSRAPPNWQRFKPENTPLYLSTRRLRI